MVLPFPILTMWQEPGRDPSNTDPPSHENHLVVFSCCYGTVVSLKIVLLSRKKIYKGVAVITTKKVTITRVYLVFTLEETLSSVPFREDVLSNKGKRRTDGPTHTLTDQPIFSMRVRLGKNHFSVLHVLISLSISSTEEEKIHASQCGDFINPMCQITGPRGEPRDELNMIHH